jgi:peptide/nickel transport system substrate-binding protein
MSSRLGSGVVLFAGLLASSTAFAKDTLTLGMVLEPPHLDPTAGAAAAIDEVVYANLFEGLTRINERGEVEPALAQGWSVSDDGLTYNFQLQENVTFHDGTGFDSADVKFTLERAMAPDSVNAQKALFEPIATIETPSPSVVAITLKRPTSSFLFDLGWGDAVIVAPESAADNKTKPVGTGPFALGQWVKGDRVELERSDTYWGEPVKLSAATFKFINDPAAATAAVLAGDVDGFSNFPAPEALVQFENDPRFKVVIGTTEGETILAINNGVRPLGDLRVRRAIAHAVDRQALIDGAMFGYGTPIGSHFAPHSPAYVDLTGMYPHDVAKAKALLAEAGVSDLKLSIKLPPPSYARRSGEIIAAQLKEAGIEAELIPVEWAQWLDQVFKNKDYQLTIVSHTEPMDIGIYARDDYYFNYHNPELNAVMQQLAGTMDPEKRDALLGSAQTIIAEDSVNGFLFQLPKQGVWDARLQGMWANSPVQANDLTNVSWAE